MTFGCSASSLYAQVRRGQVLEGVSSTTPLPTAAIFQRESSAQPLTLAFLTRARLPEGEP